MAGTSSGREGKNVVFPKTEDFDYGISPYTTLSRGFGETAASSSGSKVRAFFIGMGFLPGLVDKVIEENGEENSDALLEILLRSSTNGDSSDSLEGSLNTNQHRSIPNFFPNAHSNEAIQISNSQSSDSLDSLFDDKDPPEVSTVNQPKEEPDELSDDIEDKSGTLLMMNFSVEEVEFAIRKLGNKASIPELVDFIFAAQIAKVMKKEEAEEDDITCYVREKEISHEELYGIMAKTLQLFEMGFSENEISSAVDKLGPDVPISELANFIFAEQNGTEYVMEYKYPSGPAYSWIKEEQETDLYGTSEVKVEDFSHEPSQSRQVNFEGTSTGKRVNFEGISNGKRVNFEGTSTGKRVNFEGTSTGERVKEEDYIDEFTDDVKYSDIMENDRNKRPKYEHDDISNGSLDPYWVEEKVDTIVATMSRRNRSNPSRSLSSVAAKPPFFLFGNVSNITYESWKKMSQFLYCIEPEFVNTEFFSALNRIEGYIHNLPTENRFHILPKPPMTIEEAVPRAKKWWPPWDSRKQLNCNYYETRGITQLCDRLGRDLADAGGVLTSQQQRDILRYCRGLNLVWTGKHKLGPIEPEHMERILGYPLNHTQSAECDLTERLKLLRCCFQTDTLGYHLSVLKPIFPNGLTLLSIFSGIGGAEVSLHRLGIKIKALVSVETSPTKRKILEKWWRSSGQTGTLVQIEDIQKLASKKFENLISKLGVFDLVIYQNPCSQPIARPQEVGSMSALEFSIFCESVRVLQRVRGLCERM
ncbi:probable inactive DNA (cytosine-5)-methyltransferase DRM3 isoform X1 [Vicia villosa]|uniref:probable inactive DNA (cytosine-5)-methyltransferase DRM3 isoform X1 n=1 Tax=Vicia villosa TaxID=3911 RepID=UPI00273C0AB6|nr:probable inactive DNA (cytosine-5)-methyltransferase DRM3 isoform X1 [Vicia villosa]XP_058757352.1 probable inactive DNA (cytosine-5)-methyltransferase DRM3 isoform X1 [Vicia villosa]XP_058757360.1 probable inactive DNA (cytosine-5)-methyltransferase DRM3 isoform X1 [Vicia villosa]